MASMPPRIVIALTGPIGSGCSTLAGLFDDIDDQRKEGNRFLNYLVEKNLVLRTKNSFDVRWDDVNDVIGKELAAYSRSRGQRATTADSYEGRSEALPKVLRTILEQRESLKALSFLKAYYPKTGGHLFRTLSMSDIIVFRALYEVARGRDSLHREFDELARKAIHDINAELAKLKPVKKQVKSLEKLSIRSITEFYTAFSEASQGTAFVRAFWIIHCRVRSLKRRLVSDTKGADTAILQEFGNNIRRCGDPFARQRHSGDPRKHCVQLAQDMERVIALISQAKQGAFFLIDCLRNPHELTYFRQRFPLFYCVSIFAKKKRRFRRWFRHLKSKKLLDINEDNARKQFEDLDELDRGDQIGNVSEGVYKQDITRCVQMSDYSINSIPNQPGRGASLHDELLRLVSLVLCPGATKPRKDEVYMNMAYAMAVKSNCICRQVGAVIAGKDDYIIGAGWNDVAAGAISCGLRNLADLGARIHKPIRRQVKRDGELHLEKAYNNRRNEGYAEYPINQVCFCFKDEMAKNEVVRKLQKELHGRRTANYENLVKHDEAITGVVENAGLHQPEYCLALHAEENAVIQGSRIGGTGVRGGTIYVTAQPCTLCAKMLKQAGIRRVVYTDPYPKSLPDIFLDGVDIRQFEGVKPRAYIRLFMPSHDQKEWQDLEVQNAVPGFDFIKQEYLYSLG